MNHVFGVTGDLFGVLVFVLGESMVFGSLDCRVMISVQLTSSIVCGCLWPTALGSIRIKQRWFSLNRAVLFFIM